MDLSVKRVKLPLSNSLEVKAGSLWPLVQDACAHAFGTHILRMLHNTCLPQGRHEQHPVRMDGVAITPFLVHCYCAQTELQKFEDDTSWA